MDLKGADVHLALSKRKREPIHRLGNMGAGVSVVWDFFRGSDHIGLEGKSASRTDGIWILLFISDLLFILATECGSIFKLWVSIVYYVGGADKQEAFIARHGDIMSKRAFWGVFIRLCEQCSYHVALYALHLCLLGDKGIDETPLITMSFVYQKMVYL